MSSYHTLNCSIKKDKIKVIFQIDVPNELNFVGTNLQSALKEYMPVTESKVPFILPNELASIQNGIIYEHEDSIIFDASLSPSQKQSICNARYTVLVPIIQNYLREILRFWGGNIVV